MNGGPLDEFGLKPTHESVVYLLYGWGTSNFKIGVTTNLKKRVAQIAGHSAVPIICLGSRPGDRQLEATIHHRYSQFWSHGEWFTFPDPAVWDVMFHLGIINESVKTFAIGRQASWFAVLSLLNEKTLASMCEAEKLAGYEQNRRHAKSKLCRTGAFFIVKPDSQITA